MLYHLLLSSTAPDTPYTTRVDHFLFYLYTPSIMVETKIPFSWTAVKIFPDYILCL